LKAIEDGEDRLELPGYDSVIELISVAFKVGDVAGGEITACAVQLLDETVQHQRGHRIVDGRLAIVGAFDDVADELTDASLPFGGR